MPTSASHQRLPAMLALAEDPLGPSEAAPWIGPLVVLGSCVTRYVGKLSGRQLIVAVSVPRRDFAAVLIGCGWVMASKAPLLRPPLELLRSVDPGTPLRAVNDHHVVAGLFSSLDESASPPRVRFAGSTWRIDKIRALAVAPGLDSSEKMPRPIAGSLGRFARLDEDWEARLVAPVADLAIVGTVTWLKEDFAGFVSREGLEGEPSPIADLLLPDVGKVATWFTRVYASARFGDQSPLPTDVRAVILDGAGAIEYLAQVETPVVICIVDRSVTDETAAEIVVQMRNSRGEPISVVDDLGWRPPAGVEALAYTMAL